MIIDSHCHLDFDSFEEDLDDVISRATQAGVGVILDVATDLRSYPELIALIEKYPFIYGAFGIHPDSIDPENMISVQELLQMVHHLKIIGVGETGLDYHYENIDRKYQQESLRTHIEVARQAGLPLIIHTRDADKDMIGILKEEMLYKPFTGMIHCFSSSEQLAKTAIDLGMYISLSGIITFKKSQDLRDIVQKLPLSQLLVETDAPYLAPMPHRGKRNEPAMVVETFKQLAQIKNIPEQELAATLQKNFLTLFKSRLKKGLFQ